RPFFSPHQKSFDDHAFAQEVLRRKRRSTGNLPAQAKVERTAPRPGREVRSGPAYPPTKIRRKEVLFMAVFKDHKKDPDATLDWIFDWNLWLGATETIASAEFIVDPGITIEDSTNTTKT